MAASNRSSLFTKAHFSGSTGDADRSRDYHGFAGLWFADQTGISRESRHAEAAQPRRNRRSSCLKFAQARAIGKRVRSPSGVSENYVTFGIIRIVRCDHSRDRLTNNYIADLKWLRIDFRSSIRPRR